jgi:acetyl coenzyme A synthetase (ADP forming)-like protein
MTAASQVPSGWSFEVVLKDGTTVFMRPIVPGDAAALAVMFSKLSRRSVYQRFFRVKQELTPEELEYFTTIDYGLRMAFVVVEGQSILGVGRYDALTDDRSTAEVAFAVIDEAQGRGIGTALLRQITAYARTQGITAFKAFVLADNHAMIRVFRDSGFELSRELEEGVYNVEFPTAPSPSTEAAEDDFERRSIASSMHPLFYPHSIAVIGASRSPGSIGARLFANLVNGDFTGPVFPVNPGAPVVRSVKAYATVLDVPDPVDLAFIVVPARQVVGVVEQCAEKGVKGIVVISAGFGETAGDGPALQRELVSVVRSAGMRMIGPNCMGILNTDPLVNMDGQFGPVYPPRGNVAMSSQSGALGIAILDYASRLGIGISTFVSVGNKADVSGNDLLLYWEGDPSTDVILLYLESFGNPRRFARIARRIGRKKPIVAVKSGRTSGGARAAGSHTGSLASLDAAVDALFHQSGVIRTQTLEEMFDVTALLAKQPLPAGKRIGIVTNAGGPAILAVDALEALGLEIPELSAEVQAVLAEVLSPDASIRNPVDMIASAGPDEYRRCLSVLLESDEVDVVVAIFIPASSIGAAETAGAITAAGEGSGGRKTFLSVYMSSAGAPGEMVGGSIPVYPFPERAAKAVASAVRYSEWRQRTEGSVPVFEDVDGGGAAELVAAALVRTGDTGGWLSADETRLLLERYGIPMVEEARASSEEEAVSAAASIGGPVVLKVVAPSALHKSDVGGVALDLRDEQAVRAAFASVTSAVPDSDGVIVQRFVAGGHEVLVGMTEDPNFGPLIVFGLGGVFVELVKDVSFRISPLTDVDAIEMVREVKASQLLEGYRGIEPGDVDAVVDVLLRLSAMVEDIPELAEIDLNPVKVLAPGDGVVVVDARVRVAATTATWIPTRQDIRVVTS